MLILFILLFGMAAGWVAHLILGRGGRVDWGMALISGLLGSLLGGMIASLIAGDGLRIRPSGIIGSIVGAVIILAVVGAVRGRSSA
jgi:uncharacterized membrane protein YeaQ/YmgE (transglycosylase-associated protein family)